MFYYDVALIGLKLAPLTYKSESAIDCGAKILAPIKGKKAGAIVLNKRDRPPFECEVIADILDETLSPEYLKTAKFIAYYYICEIGEALALFTIAKKSEIKPIKIDVNIVLNDRQKEALDFIDRPKPALLFGDTGCGKSEIYMKLFERVLNNNKTALFLMPEISLTPQIEKRLKERFGSLAALWHSKISAAKKRKTLLAIASGEVRIVAGARSALFLPMPNLGVIVVDEEHDESYKSAQTPRHNARDVAIVLAKELNIPVTLGSATPSAVSFSRFETFRLKGQFFKEGGRNFRFIPNATDAPTDEALLALKETIERKKQAIVFLPTRANFKYLICQTCGESIKCPFCDVGMSVHSAKRALICHYCNAVLPIPKICPKCGSAELSANRRGVAEVAELLKKALPNAAIAQFDRDSIKSDAALRNTLELFNDRKIDILVGTQMLSKGHNYHDVETSIALGLDRLLAQCDYRAYERAVSLLTQLAGRAGRKTKALVLAQTANYDRFAPYINDYERFLKDEIARRDPLYPPHIRLLRVLVSAINEGSAKKRVEEIVEKLTPIEGVEIIGYGACPIARIKTKYRFHILLRSKSAKALIYAGEISRGKWTDIEMDPLSIS
ncbi:MAG: primosomal protein N' [Helicobacteraceae bacterium]|nr:primosomal protein N' [Helicobacteraceae bacterium]